MSAHLFADLGLIVATMDKDHPKRRAAQVHAAKCPVCARLLSNGQALLDLIDAQAAEIQLDPRLKERVMRSVEQMPRPARQKR